MDNVYMWKRQHPVRWDLLLNGAWWVDSKLEKNHYTAPWAVKDIPEYDGWTDEEVAEFAATFIVDQGLMEAIDRWEEEAKSRGEDVSRLVVPCIGAYMYSTYMDELVGNPKTLQKYTKNRILMQPIDKVKEVIGYNTF